MSNNRFTKNDLSYLRERKKLPVRPRPAITRDAVLQIDLNYSTARRWHGEDDNTRSTEEGGKYGSIQEKQRTRVSREKEVAYTYSVPTTKETTMQQTIHPLAPNTPIIRLPRKPKRPIRPTSLRLSGITRRGGLTTSRILVVDPVRQRGPDSGYWTQPHTGYIAAQKHEDAPVKYGRGKHAMIELVPQPSDDPRDPLNWQTWRKELHFYALLTTVAMCNVMKTALVSVNGPLTSILAVPYTAVAALTGVPLMLSACTGLASSVSAKVWGRRPVYLASMVLLFIGSVWNIGAAKTSYGQFMAARIFQGLGWGAFDTMVIGSIMDTHFEHERHIKIATYRTIAVATTWGPPLLGGLVAQTSLSAASLQFQILAILQTISIPLLILGAPETMYDRRITSSNYNNNNNNNNNILETPTPGWTPRTARWSSIGLKSSNSTSSAARRVPAWARGRRGRNGSVDRAIQYIKDVAPPRSYYRPDHGTAAAAAKSPVLLLSLRAAVAPTTLLAMLASSLPHALLWGLAASLSGLFSSARAPPNQQQPLLGPAAVGALLAAPLVLSAAAVAVFALLLRPPPRSQQQHQQTAGKNLGLQTTHQHLFVLGAGAALSLAGILAFALYATPSRADGQSRVGVSAVALVLGLLAAGAHVLDAPAPLLIWRSAAQQASSSSSSSGPSTSTSQLRCAADMDAGVAVWRALFAGVFAVGIPAAVVVTVTSTPKAGAWLSGAGIGVAVVQIFVAGGVGAAWGWWDESVMRLDGKVMGVVKKRVSRRGSQSFFETDDD